MWERNEFKKKINSPLLLTAKDFLTCLKKKNIKQIQLAFRYTLIIYLTPETNAPPLKKIIKLKRKVDNPSAFFCSQAKSDVFFFYFNKGI